MDYIQPKKNELIDMCISSLEPLYFAKLMYLLFNKTYICTHINKNRWYSYNGSFLLSVRWEYDEGGRTLRMKISKEIRNIFVNVKREYSDIIYEYDINNDDDKNNVFINDLKKKIKIIDKIIKKLANTYFKDSIMKHCKKLFHSNMLTIKLKRKLVNMHNPDIVNLILMYIDSNYKYLKNFTISPSEGKVTNFKYKNDI